MFVFPAIAQISRQRCRAVDLVRRLRLFIQIGACLLLVSCANVPGPQVSGPISGDVKNLPVEKPDVQLANRDANPPTARPTAPSMPPPPQAAPTPPRPPSPPVVVAPPPAVPPADRQLAAKEIQAKLLRLLPRYVKDKEGWAVDIQVPFTALNINPSSENLCSVIAVIEQESSFDPNPKVANLGKIALEEIYARGAKRKIPAVAITGFLNLNSKDGRTYKKRIETAKTEGELSQLYMEMTDRVPFGRDFFEEYNPIRTAGAMQVSVSFANNHLKTASYPYQISDSLRQEAFTRRGGLYFGIAHLLAYQAHYDAPIYRFADFNAGRYASRNAAFQKAVMLISGVEIVSDGDLLSYEKGKPKSSATLAALKAIAARANLSSASVVDDLEKEKQYSFYQTPTYNNILSLADRINKRPVARNVIPEIVLQGPKIKRKFTTSGFAEKVNQRMRQCLMREST